MKLISIPGTRYILQVCTSLRVENTGKMFVNKDIGYSGFSFSEKKSRVQDSGYQVHFSSLCKFAGGEYW